MGQMGCSDRGAPGLAAHVKSDWLRFWGPASASLEAASAGRLRGTIRSKLSRVSIA